MRLMQMSWPRSALPMPLVVSLLVMLLLLGGSAIAKDNQVDITNIDLPEIGRVTGLAKGSEGSVWVLGSKSIVQLKKGQGGTFVKIMTLADLADYVAIMPNGVIFTTNYDVLNIVLGKEPPMPLLTLPVGFMSIVSTEDGRLLIFDKSDHGAGIFSIYELQGVGGSVSLRRILDFRESIMDIEATRDVMYIATERMIYRYSNNKLEPFFSEKTSLHATGLATSPTGSLLVSSTKGLLEISRDGRTARWLNRMPSSDVVSSGQSIYLLQQGRAPNLTDPKVVEFSLKPAKKTNSAASQQPKKPVTKTRETPGCKENDWGCFFSSGQKKIFANKVDITIQAKKINFINLDTRHTDKVKIIARYDVKNIEVSAQFSSKSKLEMSSSNGRLNLKQIADFDGYHDPLRNMNISLLVPAGLSLRFKGGHGKNIEIRGGFSKVIIDSVFPDILLRDVVIAEGVEIETPQGEVTIHNADISNVIEVNTRIENITFITLKNSSRNLFCGRLETKTGSIIGMFNNTRLKGKNVDVQSRNCQISVDITTAVGDITFR